MSENNICNVDSVDMSDENSPRKKRRVDDSANQTTVEQSVESSWTLKPNYLRNLLAFLNHMDLSLFCGLEGKYVIVSNGEVIPLSFATAEEALMAAGVSLSGNDQRLSQVYMVPFR